MCMYVFLPNLCVQCPCAVNWWRSEDFRSPGAGVSGHCQPFHTALETEPGFSARTLCALIALLKQIFFSHQRYQKILTTEIGRAGNDGWVNAAHRQCLRKPKAELSGRFVMSMDAWKPTRLTLRLGCVKTHTVQQ